MEKCFYWCRVCVKQVEKEQWQDKREALKEEMVELRSWNQQKEASKDDTQVDTLYQPGKHIQLVL